ncbi:Hypothetical predicted protein, partial [Paramuricea clavata]
MVEDSSNFRRPNETSSEASSSGSGNNFDRNAAAAGFNAVPGAGACNSGGSGEATNSFGNIGSAAASTGYGGGYGGTHEANAMGNSGFFGISGAGARGGEFINQAGGMGDQAVNAGRIGRIQYFNCNFRGGGGDSGSLVFFHDKNNQKQVFAYGVCEVDELLLPEQHESASSCSFDEDESESEQEIEDENETTSESSEAE